ncbi:SDR family NAD(P)-dependent oxidoreductase [Streptococcus sp. E17BB]|uniref:SDR family NAD(P)-dependent oxidoreductase n=1 Tax=Streptococcus sp. E17BB TaxID=3278714 RepID=UPI00359CCF60
MTGRVIVMTGASGGLAQALVAQLPAADQLVLLGRSRERLMTLYGERPKTLCLGLDVRDSSAIAQTIDSIYAQFGRVDILINNAGFGEFQAFDAYEVAQIKEMFEVNTLATIHFSRLIAGKMAEQGSGHVVNIASMAGLIATAKTSIYSATKFAVIGYSNALRLEVADKGVYVTTVNPGPIATKFFETADPSGDYLKSVDRFTLSADAVASRIVAILGKNKRELNLPWLLALAHKWYTLFPTLSDWLTRKVFNYK